MDAAKLMRLLYDFPSATDLDALEARFMDITKRVEIVPPSSPSSSTPFVCIPTTSGTGSEVSPFAVITDPRNGIKYPLCDYVMTPTIAAVDSSLVASLPQGSIAAPGLDAAVHAIESYVSVLSSSFTRPLSSNALQLIFRHLVESKKGNPHSRVKVHEAATLAGIGISNAFVGIAHSIAHQLGGRYHINHGIACSIALPHVIKYNSDLTAKQMYFPQHRSASAAYTRYSELAEAIGCAEATPYDLIDSFHRLAASLNVPMRVRDACKVTREEYEKDIPFLAISAFDDQCTSSNPRYPLVKELEKMLDEMW
jgi:acetaldehyde dehydrogenase/alcohol dehydrogenase